MKVLNKIGPDMELCGTPDDRILKRLSASFILTPCCLLFSENIKMLRPQWLIPMHDVLQ